MKTKTRIWPKMSYICRIRYVGKGAEAGETCSGLLHKSQGQRHPHRYRESPRPLPSHTFVHTTPTTTTREQAAPLERRIWDLGLKVEGLGFQGSEFGFEIRGLEIGRDTSEPDDSSSMLETCFGVWG
jgi:hypothetical protein